MCMTPAIEIRPCRQIQINGYCYHPSLPPSPRITVLKREILINPNHLELESGWDDGRGRGGLIIYLSGQPLGSRGWCTHDLFSFLWAWCLKHKPWSVRIWKKHNLNCHFYFITFQDDTTDIRQIILRDSDRDLEAKSPKRRMSIIIAEIDSNHLYLYIFKHVKY